MDRTTRVAASATLAVAGLASLRSRQADRTHPPTADTHMHRSGRGTPLLHGVRATWRARAPMLPLLEPHHDVIVPTLLGYSGAQLLADGVVPSVDAIVDGVEAKLDRLNLDRVHVVGNSLDGWCRWSWTGGTEPGR